MKSLRHSCSRTSSSEGEPELGVRFIGVKDCYLLGQEIKSFLLYFRRCPKKKIYLLSSLCLIEARPAKLNFWISTCKGLQSYCISGLPLLPFLFFNHNTPSFNNIAISNYILYVSTLNKESEPKFILIIQIYRFSKG